MKAVPLPEQDRRDCDEANQVIQARVSRLAALKMRAGMFAVIFLLSIGGEYCLTYSVVNDVIGPLPGEPASAVSAIVSFAGLIAVIAFYFYKRVYPASLPVRLVNALAGYVALSFVIVMGLMLSQLIHENSASDAVSFGALFGEQNSEGVSFLSRFFNLLDGPFALIFGLLTICNLYVAELVLTKLRSTAHELGETHACAVQAHSAVKELEESERELARLDGERQRILRALEPAGAQAFADELAAVIDEARSPTEQFITAHQIRKKSAESVVRTEAETDIDLVKLKERVSALQLDGKVIYASFPGNAKAVK